MLKPQDIEMTFYCSRDGGSVKILHKPTGIFRAVENSRRKLQHQALREIEAELRERGLTQHLLLPKR